MVYLTLAPRFVLPIIKHWFFLFLELVHLIIHLIYSLVHDDNYSLTFYLKKGGE